MIHFFGGLSCRDGPLHLAITLGAPRPLAYHQPRSHSWLLSPASRFLPYVSSSQQFFCSRAPSLKSALARTGRSCCRSRESWRTCACCSARELAALGTNCPLSGSSTHPSKKWVRAAFVAEKSHKWVSRWLSIYSGLSCHTLFPGPRAEDCCCCSPDCQSLPGSC